MKFKKHLFGQSIVWLGVLYGNSDSANAETRVPFVPNLPTQESYQTTDDPFITKIKPSGVSNEEHLPAPKMVIANMTPAEELPHVLERITSKNFGERFISSEGSRASRHFEDDAQEEQNSSEFMTLPDQDLDVNPDVDPASLFDELTEDGQPSDAIEPDAIEPNETEQRDELDSIDPELGNLRLQERTLIPQPPASQQTPETVFLVGRLNLFRSDNILLDDFDPVDDQLFQVGVSLVAIPSLGRQTQLIASIGGNLTRYNDLSDLNYNNLELQVGIQQELSPRTYGEISWSNQHYFAADSGDRFLNDHSLRLTVAHREQLASQLTLDGFYQLRVSFTDPIDRSRISNTVGASLNYNFQQNLGVGLDYQFVLTHFTQREREDGYHQLIAQLNYNLSRNNRVSLFGGFSFGRSSDSDIDFSSSILGVAFSTNVALF